MCIFLLDIKERKRERERERERGGGGRKNDFCLERKGQRERM